MRWTHENAVQTADGTALLVRDVLPPGDARAVVVIVHGYAEHSGRYAHVAHAFAEARHAVFTYDQRGYGRSGGRPATIRSFETYVKDLGVIVEHVRRKHPDRPLFVMGHSMGGAVATLFSLESHRQPAGLILSSPALRVSRNVSPLLQKLSPLIGRLFPHLPTVTLDRAALSHDPAVVQEAEEDPLNFHGRMPACTGAQLIAATKQIGARMEELSLPLLLIHGTADRLTDPEGSAEMYRRARSTDKTFGLYPDLYHETFNEPDLGAQVLDEMVTWLDEHLP